MEYGIRKIEECDFQELIALFQEFAYFEKLPEKMTNSSEQMKSEIEHINGFVALDKNSKVIGYVIYFFIYYT